MKNNLKYFGLLSVALMSLYGAVGTAQAQEVVTDPFEEARLYAVARVDQSYDQETITQQLSPIDVAMNESSSIAFAPTSASLFQSLGIKMPSPSTPLTKLAARPSTTTSNPLSGSLSGLISGRGFGGASSVPPSLRNLSLTGLLGGTKSSGAGLDLSSLSKLFGGSTTTSNPLAGLTTGVAAGLAGQYGVPTTSAGLKTAATDYVTGLAGQYGVPTTSAGLKTAATDYVTGLAGQYGVPTTSAGLKTAATDYVTGLADQYGMPTTLAGLTSGFDVSAINGLDLPADYQFSSVEDYTSAASGYDIGTSFDYTSVADGYNYPAGGGGGSVANTDPAVLAAFQGAGGNYGGAAGSVSTALGSFGGGGGSSPSGWRTQ